MLDRGRRDVVLRPDDGAGAEQGFGSAKTEKAAKKKPVAKPKPKVEAKAEGAAKTAAQPAAAAAQPAALIRPLAEEAHVARYDAAIAQVRDVVLAAEEAGKLREAIAAAAGSRVQDAKALRDKLPTRRPASSSTGTCTVVDLARQARSAPSWTPIRTGPTAIC